MCVQPVAAEWEPQDQPFEKHKFTPIPPQTPNKEEERRIIPSHSINIIVYVSNGAIYYPSVIYGAFRYPIPPHAYPAYM